MTQTKSVEHTEKKLPRRDWILLPLLNLVTMGLISGAAVLLGGWMFSKDAPGRFKCMEMTALGVHGKPNAVCSDKLREAPLIEYRLNSCGYRMDVECGLPQPGTYRIVMMGSSIVIGEGVSRERSLAALLPGDLSLRTGRKIEVYNEGMWLEHPPAAALRFNEVLAAKPNIVLWIVAPYDIGFVILGPASLRSVPPVKAGLAARGWRRLRSAATTGTFAAIPGEAWLKARDKFIDSSTGVMLMHYLYQSETRYIDSYLRGPDTSAGFLRAEPSAAWSNDLKVFEKEVVTIQGQAKAVDVPLVVVLVPSRAEAAMISMGRWPTGFDPYKLGEELRPIIERHGGTYIDILPDFRAIPNPERYYFPVDGHPDADGHALLSKLMAKGLTSGPVPTLRAATQQPDLEHRE